VHIRAHRCSQPNRFSTLAADSRRYVLLIAADSSRFITRAPAPIGANRQLSALIGGENQFSKDALIILSTMIL
jgi:hypothetical protein